jgi:hypothetical protein
MQQMYGAAFLTAYGEKPNPLWEAAISKLTDEQCRKGLASLAKQSREYPANLTQFVAVCTEKPPVRFLGGPSSMYNPRQLEGPRANPENVKSRLESIRRKLGQ